MTLADLLALRRIVVPLAAATRAEGIALLVEACVADGRVRNAAKLRGLVRDPWPEDSLSLGPHAILRHLRTDAVDSVVVALGVAPAPLRAADPEAGGGRIMLLVVAPPGEAGGYLQTVAAFARALSRAEVIDGLHAARRPADVLALPALGEVRLEGQLLVRDIMAPAALSLTPDASVASGAQLLLRHRVDAAPVIGPGGEVLGLLSLRDLLRVLAPPYVQRVQTGEYPVPRRKSAGAPGDPGSLAVREVMARNVLCVSEDQSVAEVATLLAHKDVTSVPVVRDGVLRGMVTRTEIVRTLVTPLELREP